ncbi:MAG: SMP-30/gluconolactonase/LRE family protein [Cyanobacteria bacterium P01_A01_bin.68]
MKTRQQGSSLSLLRTMASIKISTIGSTVSKWGEGPIWWQNKLLYVDINGHKIIRLDPTTEEETVWDLGERVGTVVPTEGDDLIYAGDTGFVRFNPESGTKTPMADPEADLREINRFNDGKCDPDGRFWAGSISLVKKEGTANLYCLDTDGSLNLKIEGVTNSNGICWSLDGGKMYYIDTPQKCVQAFDFDSTTGGISNASKIIDTEANGYQDSPDGMTIDSEGMLWIAFCHGGVVVRFDPATGSVIQEVKIPCVETTAVAFGGEKLERLFVTTGIHKSIVEEDAGKVFVVDGLGVTGVPAFAYQG